MYKNGGKKALRVKKRGRPTGSNRTLKLDQEKEIQKAIYDKCPDQIKLPFALWTPEFKESMLQKIFFNPNRSVVSFAREASIPDSTVATWVRNCKKKNGKIMGQKKRKQLWSAEKRFETVLLTAPMSEAEKSEYCRKHGIYQELGFD